MSYHHLEFRCDRCGDAVPEPTATFEFFSAKTCGAMDLCRPCALFCINLLRTLPDPVDIDNGYLTSVLEHEPPDTYDELRIA